MEDNIISLTASAQGSTLTKVKIKSFEYEVDEPEFFGGNSLAPSPVDYLLGAVAGCVVAAGTYMAKEMGFELKRLDVRVDGTINSGRFLGLTDEKRSGFQDIRIILSVDSNADEAVLKSWKEGLLFRCPVIDNLLHPAAVSIEEGQV